MGLISIFLLGIWIMAPPPPAVATSTTTILASCATMCPGPLADKTQWLKASARLDHTQRSKTLLTSPKEGRVMIKLVSKVAVYMLQLWVIVLTK